MKYLHIPTRNVYDYAYSAPYSGNQEVIIPSLHDSTYYILIYGSTTSAVQQKISLYAKILHFEIRSVDADEGGNTGKVTIILNGSKFDSTLQIRLKGDSATYVAEKVVYVNPTKVFATFNLSGAKLGIYDVEAIKPTLETARLVDGFSIVRGVPSDLEINVSRPANVRTQAIVSMTVEWSNNGNTDIDIPTLVLKSLASAPIGLTIPEIDAKKTQLEFELREYNGPQYVLRPGSSGSVLVYSKSTAGLGFLIKLPKIK
jgi:hypothetical protein